MSILIFHQVSAASRTEDMPLPLLFPDTQQSSSIRSAHGFVAYLVATTPHGGSDVSDLIRETRRSLRDDFTAGIVLPPFQSRRGLIGGLAAGTIIGSRLFRRN
jgi:hypothetical protein